MISAATSFLQPRIGAATPAGPPDGDGSATAFDPAMGPPAVAVATAPGGAVAPAALASTATLVALGVAPPAAAPIALPLVDARDLSPDGGARAIATLPMTAGNKPGIKVGVAMPAILVVGPASTPPAPAVERPVTPATPDPRTAPPLPTPGEPAATTAVAANDDADGAETLPVDGVQPAPTAAVGAIASAPTVAIVADPRPRRDGADATPVVALPVPLPLATPAPVEPVPMIAHDANMPAAGGARPRRSRTDDRPERTGEDIALTAAVPITQPMPTPIAVTHPTAPATGPTPAVAAERAPDIAPAAADAKATEAAPPQPTIERLAPAPHPGGGAPSPTAAPQLPAAPQVAAHISVAPTPAPAPATPPVDAGVVAAQAGRIGQEMGVVIARHAATGGGEAITVRLDPADMGRIEVKLSFSEGGTLRAVVAAENPASLDLLRRDSADLSRALTDAGVRADQQTLRFDDRPSSDGNGGGQAWQRRPDPRTAAAAQDYADTVGTDPIYRPLATSGRIDMMA